MQELKITAEDIAAHGVQSRPDKLTGTAAENKAVFDALTAGVVREKFNALIDLLAQSGGAGSIGIETITGLAATEVQTALEQIIVAMQEMTQGAVANASITLAKLAAEVTAAALGGAAAEHTHDAANIGTGVLDAARVPVIGAEKISDGAVTNAKLGEKSVSEANLCTAAVTKEKLGSLAVQTSHIAPEAVTGAKIAANAVGTEKIADGAVTAGKIADGIPYTKFGLTSEQVRRITYGTADPSGGSDGDIYLQYGS